MSYERSGSISQSPSLDIAMIDNKNNGSLLLSKHQTVPQWIPDKEASQCMCCDKKFGTVTRRIHHCRACGFVVCNSCSLSRLQLPHTAGRVRVCDRCVRDLQQKPVASNSTSAGGSNPAQYEQSLTSPSALHAPMSANAAPRGSISTTTTPSSAQTTATDGDAKSPTPNPTTGATTTRATTQQQQLREWSVQVEKERDMNMILNASTNGYTDIPSIYTNLAQIRQKTAAPNTTAPKTNTIAPFEVPGVGQDVPDWAYTVHPMSNTSHIARIGRLKLSIAKVEQLLLNNITTSLQSNVVNSLHHHQLENNQMYVRDATLSAVVTLGSTFHQTNPMDIIVNTATEGDAKPTAGGVVKGAKGVCNVAQRCVLDVCDVTETVVIDLIIHKTVVNKITQPDNTIIMKTNTLTIPIGSVSIPLTSLQLNSKQSLTLHIAPHSGAASNAAGGAGGQGAQRRSTVVQKAAAKKSATPSTITLEAELCCSPNGYLFSQYRTMNAVQVKPSDVTMYNLMQYALLILSSLQPILTALLFLTQLFTWDVPILTICGLVFIMFTALYPVSLPLLCFFALALKVVLTPFLAKQATPTTTPTTNAATDAGTKKVEYTDQKELLSYQLDTTKTGPLIVKHVDTAVLHSLSSLSPDSSLSVTTATLLSNPTAQSNAAKGVVLTGTGLQQDLEFSDLFLEFLAELLPLMSTLRGPSQYIKAGGAYGGEQEEESGEFRFFSNSTLLSFFQSLFNLYTIVITPIVDFVQWRTSIVYNAIVVVVLALGFVSTFFIPSHFLYMLIGLFPFIYTSPPCRLLRVYLNNKQ